MFISIKAKDQCDEYSFGFDTVIVSCRRCADFGDATTTQHDRCGLFNRYRIDWSSRAWGL